MKLQLADFFNKLASVRSWDQFVSFFEQQTLPTQIIICIVILGLAYVIYVFLAGIFTDNYE